MSYLPHILSLSRILCSPALLFLQPLSFPFMMVYASLGITDMLDGFLARRLNSESGLGALLDSLGDLCFIAFSFMALLPVLNLEAWHWLWILLVFLLRAGNLARIFIRQRRFVFPHTKADKIIGFLLFLTPFCLCVMDFAHIVPFLCAIATYAAVSEWNPSPPNRRNREYKHQSGDQIDDGQ